MQVTATRAPAPAPSTLPHREETAPTAEEVVALGTVPGTPFHISLRMHRPHGLCVTHHQLASYEEQRTWSRPAFQHHSVVRTVRDCNKGAMPRRCNHRTRVVSRPPTPVPKPDAVSDYEPCFSAKSHHQPHVWQSGDVKDCQQLGKC